MAQRCVSNNRRVTLQRFGPALLLLGGILASVPASRAQINLGPITVGAGLRTSFTHSEADGAESTDKFQLDSARIYISGPVTKQIKFMFNTEYDGSDKKIGVLDAVAQISVAPQFNLWAGRFLPPSDRANLYGPYYANQWGVYTDGIQAVDP